MLQERGGRSVEDRVPHRVEPAHFLYQATRHESVDNAAAIYAPDSFEVWACGRLVIGEKGQRIRARRRRGVERQAGRAFCQYTSPFQARSRGVPGPRAFVDVPRGFPSDNVRPR